MQFPTSFFAFFFLAVATSSSSMACQCDKEPLENVLSNQDGVALFSGRVMYELYSDNEVAGLRYAVHVNQVYKGCTVGEGETVVVSTSDYDRTCGLSLQSRETYVFHGAVGSKNSMPEIKISFCGYNMLESDMSAEESKRLRLFRKFEQNVCDE